MTNFDNIPKELQELPQWVCCGESKVPLNPSTLEWASCSNPKTWSDFDTVKECLKNGEAEYAGFVFDSNELVGIDLDDGFDDYGLITPKTADIIESCESYTEISRSGRGVHIIVKGDLPFNGRNNHDGVEIYKDSRYFVMTGNMLVFSEIKENQAAIDTIVEKYFPETLKESKDGHTPKIYNTVWEPSECGRIKVRPHYPKIPSGCRNICLTSVAGVLHSQGYKNKNILDEITYANKTACDPPLPDWELKQIVKSVSRYKR